ncbi:MAG TPA: HAMP domain-containing sensor histidine kinase [Bacteroidales bacterium]|nr:HAMP domain-containing sensor histidine kinase [Bacteroidales bacterium]HPT03265.1 HAMP domain-containing sensor histidine kinase [Bacteroidales bacterium]
MKRNNFLLIVILSALSLAGVVFFQFFWMRSAIQLQEDQFDNKVKLALKGIVNELYECKNDTCTSRDTCSFRCATAHRPNTSHINTRLLDSLVRTEFVSMKLEGPYIYGIFHQGNNKVIYVSNPAYESRLPGTAHYSSLSCIFSKSDYYLGAIFPNEHKLIFNKVLWWTILCFFLIAILIFGFSFTIWSFLRQKRLTEIKNDFVNNMTHEFKTPIATISLASELLQKPAILASPSRATKYASIIYDENQRLKNQVEHVLQIAVLDRHSYNLKLSEFDLHELINHVVENFRIVLKERKGKLELFTDAENSILVADKMHVQSMLMNLLDNANKYSASEPSITIRTSNSADGIVFSVEDRGIGISAENQRYIFKKLFRVPTGDVHDVKGFGLGLFYVKNMAEAHGGSIKVKSEPGHGSRFDVYLPFKQPVQTPETDGTKSQNTVG